MIRIPIIWLLIFTTLSLAAVSEEERQKIESSIPQNAVVKPLKSRKLLVVTLNKRDGKIREGHPSIEPANLALQLMGEKTGAFEVVFSNDTLMFKAENLKQFDAICFNNTVGVLFENSEFKKNLLDFVKEGKGFIGIHAAAATFVQWPVYDQWPAFGEMLGAYEDGGHPWKPHETIVLHIEEPSHPITAAFKTIDFEISDEVFQFRAPYSRDSLRVLLTINPEKTDMNPERRILQERLKDRDLAISWIRQYGKGRVFYSSLGHNKHIFWNTPVLEHFLAGIQFALGDLGADARASNLVKKLSKNK